MVVTRASRTSHFQLAVLSLLYHNGVDLSDVAFIGADANLQLFSRPSLNIAYVGLTVTRGPLGDKKVRQALNHAVDKETLINAFYEGYAIPAKKPMPPVVAGYNEAIADYPFDLDKEKELLAEALATNFEKNWCQS